MSGNTFNSNMGFGGPGVRAPPKGANVPAYLLGFIVVVLCLVIGFGYYEYNQVQTNMNNVAAALNVKSSNINSIIAQAKTLQTSASTLASINKNLAAETAQAAQLTTSNSALQASLALAQQTVMNADDYILTQYIGQDAATLAMLKGVRDSIISVTDTQRQQLCSQYDVLATANMLKALVTTEVAQDGTVTQNSSGQCTDATTLTNYLINMYRPGGLCTTIWYYSNASARVRVANPGNGNSAVSDTWYTIPSTNVLYSTMVLPITSWSMQQDSLGIWPVFVMTDGTQLKANVAIPLSTLYKPNTPVPASTSWAPVSGQWVNAGAQPSSVQLLGVEQSCTKGSIPVFNELTALSMQISVLINSVIDNTCPNGTLSADAALQLATNLHNTICNDDSTVHNYMQKTIDYATGKYGSFILGSTPASTTSTSSTSSATS